MTLLPDGQVEVFKDCLLLDNTAVQEAFALENDVAIPKDVCWLDCDSYSSKARGSSKGRGVCNAGIVSLHLFEFSELVDDIGVLGQLLEGDDRVFEE